MFGVVATVSTILVMCSASRFEGTLNVDLNEVTINLVPFPRLHYLIPSMAPLYSLLDVALPPRRSVTVPVYIFNMVLAVVHKYIVIYEIELVFSG